VHLRQLACFFAVAQELHFGRAAERLGIGQASVSEAIKALEQDIGGSLFDRTSRRVSLTHLGEMLLKGAEFPYISLSTTIRDCREQAAGRPRRLRFGFFGGGLYELHRPFVEEICRGHKDIKLEMIELSFLDHFHGVRQGDVDIAFCRLPLGAPGLVHGTVLMKDRRMLCLPHGHRLLAFDRLPAEALGGETLVRLPSGVTNQEWLDFHLPTHTPDGAQIHQGPEVRTMREAMNAVVAGKALMILTRRAASYYSTPGVSLVEIELPPISSALVWRREDRRPVIRTVNNILTSLAQQHC
jgi:LysR family transcriptional regulator, benzoate and cis,cis-muconate-responsive activator of ben and cat genes